MARRLLIISGTAGNQPFYAAFDTTQPTAAQDIGGAVLQLLASVPDGSSTTVTTLVVELVNGG